MTAQAPKAVGAAEAATRVIPAAPTGQAGELIGLAANTTDHDDRHDVDPAPTLHQAPRAQASLPEPKGRHVVDRDPADQLMPDAVTAESAALLGVSATELPRLIATLRSVLESRGTSLDPLLAEADGLGIDRAQAVATLVCVSLPERFAQVAELASAPAQDEAQVLLAMSVTALLTDELARTMPKPDALRLAASASGRLSRASPEDIVLVGVSIPLLIEGMGRTGRVEAATTIAALVHVAPDTLARVTRENRETRLLIEARAMAERSQAPDPEVRGLAVAAAYVLLATSPTPEAARALFERANHELGVAAPRVILSSAADDEDRERDLDERVVATLDRLVPFLDRYDQLRAQMVQASTVPRAELCNALHAQLTRGSEKFYIALLSLLKRHSAFCTRSGTRALRTALRDRATWDDLEIG